MTTIAQLIISGINWIVRHPRVITVLLPATKAKARTAYNTEYGANTFYPALCARIRTLDSSYDSYSDSELTALIDETLGDDEVFILDQSDGGA